MGYGNLKGLVNSNRAVLELILQALQSGSQLELPVKDPAGIDNERWALRRILKATSACPEEADGRYAGLEKLVRLGLTFSEDGPKILVKLKGQVTAPSFTVPDPSIETQLLELEGYAGEMFIFKSKAELSPSEASDLRSKCFELGWRLGGAARKMPDGSVQYYAEPLESQPATSPLAKFGFGRSA